MFDSVRNNQKIIQIVLALIVLPFAFWGVDSYIANVSSNQEVASVGKAKIGIGEFQSALREQQERMRPALGGRDPSLLDTPQLRRAVLDNLINQRLLLVHAIQSNLTISDQQLANFITSVPALQDNGQFSRQRYEALVAGQGMSTEVFEANVRRDLAQQQSLTAVTDGVLPGTTATARWLAAQLEEREISEAVLRPAQYLARVKVPAEAARAFYEANKKQFEMPEQLRAEYLVLSQDKLLAQTVVAEADIKAAYQARNEQFKQAEERRASHILITAAKTASEAELKAAEAKALDVLAQVRKAPGDFAKLAKQYSQDPGSANRGGDLDWFGRGAMVKPFEDATFSLKEGQTSELVRSDFGFHIIKVTGIRAERVKALDEVRGELANELKHQSAAKQFAEMAENFSNTVYEQADSLQPAAEKFRLEIQQSGWLSKDGAADGPFANAKLRAALFADDAIANKRNTEAVEIAPGTLVAARVVGHKAAATQPFEAVAGAIEKMLTDQEAAKLAARDGEEKLARLAKGEKVDVSWGPSRPLSRATAANLAPHAVSAIFKADASKLPAYVGTGIPGGFALFRISQVKPFTPQGDEPPRAKALKTQYARQVAEAEFSAWMSALRARYPVEINKAMLEAKDQR